MVFDVDKHKNEGKNLTSVLKIASGSIDFIMCTCNIKRTQQNMTRVTSYIFNQISNSIILIIYSTSEV